MYMYMHVLRVIECGVSAFSNSCVAAYNSDMYMCMAIADDEDYALIISQIIGTLKEGNWYSGR